jgi:hypothetical protein
MRAPARAAVPRRPIVARPFPHATVAPPPAASQALFNYQKYVKVRQGGIQPLPMDDDDKSSSTSEGDSEGERSAGPSPRRSPRRRDWRSDEEGQPPVRLHSWRSDEDALPPSRRATARRGEQPLRPGSACEPEIRVITGRQASTP